MNIFNPLLLVLSMVLFHLLPKKVVKGIIVVNLCNDIFFVSQVLCLHLKRFKFQAFHRSKVDTYVQFPMRGLDMSPYSIQSQVRAGKTLVLLEDKERGANVGNI